MTRERLHPAWFLVLRRPRAARENLRALHARGVIPGVPTPFQMLCGVLYMAHRLLFRSDTIGLERREPVRATRLARLLRARPLRFWFLVWERAINPFDLTGFGSRRDYLVRHVLGAHHAGHDAIYDLTLLLAHDGALAELRARALDVIAERTPHDRFLKDLCVYERYHERLLGTLDLVEAGRYAPDDAAIASDGSLPGFVAWCLARPATAREAWTAWRGRALRTA